MDEVVMKATRGFRLALSVYLTTMLIVLLSVAALTRSWAAMLILPVFGSTLYYMLMWGRIQVRCRRDEVVVRGHLWTRTIPTADIQLVIIGDRPRAFDAVLADATWVHLQYGARVAPAKGSREVAQREAKAVRLLLDPLGIPVLSGDDTMPSIPRLRAVRHVRSFTRPGASVLAIMAVCASVFVAAVAATAS